MQHRTQSTADRIVRLVERLYLDLFAWIQLTRARLGRPGSEPHVRAYQALRAAGGDTSRRREELAGYGWRYRAAPAGAPLERVQDAIARATEFGMLRGPGDDDLPHARELGYDPGRAAGILENIRTREAELAAY